MGRSFKQGVFVGILAPLVFMGAVAAWVFRYTGKLPFPVSRPEEGELTIKLVYPEEVSAYWRRWRDEIAPLQARLCALGRELKARYWDSYLTRES